MDNKVSGTEIALYVIGAIALGYGAVKGWVIGYYPNEALFTYLCLFGGLGLLAAASAIGKKRKARALAARDRSKGVL